jgi:hypothetical protein
MARRKSALQRAQTAQRAWRHGAVGEQTEIGEGGLEAVATNARPRTYVEAVMVKVVEARKLVQHIEAELSTQHTNTQNSIDVGV